MTCRECGEEFDEPDVEVTAVATRETPEESVERCPHCWKEFYELADV